MKHYRQIIINIEVEDDLPEEKLDYLVENFSRQSKRMLMKMRLKLIM